MFKINESIIVIQAEAINPIQTNVVFWSHDRGTAKLRMKLVRKDGVPQSLPEGTTVPIRLIFRSATAEDGYGKHDYLATIEDRVNGIVSIVLEDNILGYVGKVEGSVYIDFPNDRSLDTAGRFTFYIKRSPIDDSTPELEDYYFNGFSQTIDKIEKILADGKQEIDQKIAESETQIDGKLKETNDKITKASQDVATLNTNIDKTDDRIDQINQQIGDIVKLRTDIDTLETEKADKTFVTSQLAQKVNKSEVTNKLTPKGNADYDSLPTDNNSVGDYYYCSDGDGTNGAGNYVWNGAVWYFGGTGDEGYSKLNTDLSDSKKKVFKNIRIAYSDTFDVQANTDISGSVVKVDIPTGTAYTIEITDINNTGALEGLTVYEKGADGLLTSIGRVKIGTIATVKAGKNVEFLNVYTPTKPTADAKYRIDVVKVIHTEGSIEERLELFKNEATFNSINATAKSSTKNGVNLTSNGDGTYTVNGTATARTNFHMFDETYYPKNTESGEYKLIGCPSGGSLNTYFLEAAFRNIQGDTILNKAEVGEGLSLTLNENAVSMYLTITIMEGETVEDLVFKPMLTTNMNATYDSFVGYTGERDKINENVAEIQKKLSEKLDISQATKNIDELKKQTLCNMVTTSTKSKTLNGVTLTDNNDGTYTVNGTASANTLFHLNDVYYFEKSIDPGIYKVLGCPQNGGESTYYLETAFKNVKGEVKANRKDIGNGTEPLYLEEPMVSMYLAIGIKAGQTVNQLVFKPMFTKNLDTTYNDFVGYTGENDKLNKNVAEIQKKLSEKPDAAYPSNLYWEDTVKPPYWVFHLDCARKYFTVANVKLLIDKISKSGFNQIQLHFSEDSGFRLELDNMMVTDEDGVSYDLSSALGGTESPDKWYTQADMDSIISYAQSKNIDVVPSFDMPGHMGRILYRFPQFKLEGSNTLDITNDVAVKFAKAIVKKYCKYFSSRGSHHWNIGYDEIVGSKGFDLFYNEGNYKFVVDFANTLINVVKEYDLIPRMYNEAVYYNKDYNYYVSKDVELYYWYTDWAEYTLPDVLQKSGYKLINNSYKYYWILDKEEDSTSVDVINQTELLKDFFNRKTDKNGYGAVFAIWCDSANTSISKGDGGDGVVSSVTSLITAFGNAISRAYEQ